MYANDDVFNIKYNSELDRLEVAKTRKRKVLYFLTAHKFFTTTVIMFIILSIINCLLVYNFMEIMKTML